MFATANLLVHMGVNFLRIYQHVRRGEQSINTRNFGYVTINVMQPQGDADTPEVIIPNKVLDEAVSKSLSEVTKVDVATMFHTGIILL